MRKGEKRKQELLQIAYRMFITRGYENTSVDEIIEEAGIAKGTYYYHFPSKEQTLEQVIDMMLDAQEEHARAVMAADMPIPQKVVGVIASFRPDASETTITDALHAPENIVMHDKTERKLRERIVPIISELVEQGIEEGIFNCKDIPERVKIIIILASELFDAEGFTQTDVKVFVDVIESILGAKPGTMAFITQLIG
ncbi:MAG: TetR/AcrR family transcriptional regulator [Clostridiales bacterium]|nr:TetR/AcrR family transcriptional regulator [Clostridiales bacterium]